MGAKKLKTDSINRLIMKIILLMQTCQDEYTLTTPGAQNQGPGALGSRSFAQTGGTFDTLDTLGTSENPGEPEGRLKGQPKAAAGPGSQRHRRTVRPYPGPSLAERRVG